MTLTIGTRLGGCVAAVSGSLIATVTQAFQRSPPTLRRQSRHRRGQPRNTFTLVFTVLMGSSTEGLSQNDELVCR